VPPPVAALVIVMEVGAGFRQDLRKVGNIGSRNHLTNRDIRNVCARYPGDQCSGIAIAGYRTRRVHDRRLRIDRRGCIIRGRHRRGQIAPVRVIQTGGQKALPDIDRWRVCGGLRRRRVSGYTCRSAYRNSFLENSYCRCRVSPSWRNNKRHWPPRCWCACSCIVATVSRLNPSEIARTDG